MRPKSPPPAEFGFAYADPPKSGNLINGVGETARRRPRVIWVSESEECEHRDLYRFHGYIEKFRIFIHSMVTHAITVRSYGPVAKQRISVDNPVALTRKIKETAKTFGAGIVGIAKADSELLLYLGQPDFPYENVIVVGLPMDREAMKTAPHFPAGMEVMRGYRENTVTTNPIARHIRKMGWPAEAYTVKKHVLIIPTAIQAGLGELGKHGSLISKEYGSNFRLGLVGTDLPLVPDSPVDLGVEDLCLACRACTANCPAGAITDSKLLVRGVERWQVDFDRCINYFVANHGCSICIEVCPWSEPGRGVGLSEKLLARRLTNT